MKIKVLLSTPENISGRIDDWEVSEHELISSTLNRELNPDWLTDHTIRVIYQGRILPVGQSWTSSTDGTLQENAVVHLYVRKIVDTTPGPEPRIHTGSDSAVWSTVSVLRVQRVLVDEHPGVLFSILILITLSYIWWIRINRPRMLDSFSCFILYGATAASLLVACDKISRRVRTNTGR
eukprot:Blabericola_migrator_1__267@NODE_106_length_14174_cov_318_190118_g94_i0_p7_GENE_NODE_106_length_14174_cov_318_190118_g94_i0NODE_106_length_14174_cov_318_190118_g94_i0_p7_ORF_typecomplete_len179_score17_49Rad60SLD_2/PF13881_6/0_096DUF2407/PF10302_9/0_11_NODE_106_length_14174_cov_318_190118_g94_i01166812204